LHSSTGRIVFTIGCLLSALAAPSTTHAQYSLISVATDGTQGNHLSESPSVSADGRFVAFESLASNLVAGDTNESRDIFVRDRVAQVTTRVSVTSGGEERTGHSRLPKITANGRWVVFQSKAALVADDTNTCVFVGPGCDDIYLHDRQSGTTTRLSVTSGGAQGDDHSRAPTISADGRYVAFTSLASNLVVGDSNGASDVFLRDRETNTTIRVSLSPDGGQNPGASTAAMLSADGRVITFSGVAPASAFPTPQPCANDNACPATFAYVRETSQVEMLSAVVPPFASAPQSVLASEELIAISGDGAIVLIEQGRSGVPALPRRSVVYDRTSGQVRLGVTDLSDPFNPEVDNFRGISPDGRYLFEPHTSLFVLRDRLSGHGELVNSPPQVGTLPFVGATIDFSSDDRFVAFVGGGPWVAGDANGVEDIYLLDRDTDADGIAGSWESAFGFNPADAGDATGDPDGDGLTNLQEFQRGTHPNGTFKRYFAEGAVNAFFSTRLAAANPNGDAAAVTFQFQGSNGFKSNAFRSLGSLGRTSMNLRSLAEAPSNDFATLVESDRPLALDRTMRWGATGYGASTETAITAPSTTWYLAEGATHGAFDLFYLLQNPGDSPAQVTVRYLRLAGAPPIVKTYDVAPRTRHTIWVDDEDPGLAEAEMGATITSDVPIIVERAMYASTPAESFAAGHEGAGVAAPANTWFLAEGATGSFFDLYVLVANPNTTASQLTVTYLLPGGVHFTKPYTVTGESRLTISVDGEDPRLADTPVSVIVASTNNQPVVVERAMWWPSPNWYEAHLSAGATSTGTRWALADGEVSTGGTTSGDDIETYVLIANTSATAGSAELVIARGNGLPSITHTVDLPANSRVNVPISGLLPFGSRVTFSTFVTSDVEIVVERAMYFDVGGVTWAAGTAALATKSQ
jgi:hypothetical protein